MQRGISGGSGRKGIPLDVWSEADVGQRPENGGELKSPWQTHRVGISQASSAWSTGHSAAGNGRSRTQSRISNSDFPALLASKPEAVAAVAVAKCESRGSGALYSIAAQGLAPCLPPTSLIRDCVKELRRMFPNAECSVLEDVTAGLAIGLKSDGCLSDLLEQAVSRLLDVFADAPGIRCAFPFPVSQPVTAGEPATWKHMVGARAVGKQNKKSHSAVSVVTDAQYYRAAIESLTEKYQRPLQQQATESEGSGSVHIEGRSGMELRWSSQQIAKSRAQLFSEAAKAFIAGDPRLAKELSSRGHELTSDFRELSEAAAEGIFLSKNSGLNEGVIDLHGLHRDEAFEAVTSFVVRLRLNPPNSSLGAPLIVCGKGIHSKGAPVLQATAKEALIAAGCTFQVAPGGNGTLVVTNW